MSNKVLLLNKNESILNIVEWQTAVCLYFTNKAIAPYEYDDFYEIKTVKGIFKLPTALVLAEYVHLPYRQAQLTKSNVLKRDKFICAYCEKQLTTSSGSIDHIIPKSRWPEFLKNGLVKGSYNDWRNVISSCFSCNCKKDNRTPKEANMKLLRTPFVPSREYLIMRGINSKTREAWERWIQLKDDLK
jgi:5-methylcytosine-specific restriction endonuclease McrA